MELEFETKQLSYWKNAFCHTAAQEQTQEVIVPDSFPDAARVVSCIAQAVLRSKEIRDGSAVITGAIRASCLYVAEQEQTPRTLDAYFPFSLRIDEPALTQQMKTVLELRINAADARLINSRKVLIRIGLGCRMTGYEDTIETYQTIKNVPERVQIHEMTYHMRLPAAIAEKPFSFSEELELPTSRPPVGTLAGYTVALNVTEQRVVGARAAFKAEAALKLLYLTPDGIPEVFTQSIPFSQFCELGEEVSDDECDIQLVLTGAELELQGSEEEKQLLLQMDLLAQCVVYGVQDVTVCDDAYAVGGELKTKWQEMTVSARLDRQSFAENVRESVDGDVRAIADSTAYPGFPVVRREGDCAQISFPITVNILAYDKDGNLQLLNAKTESNCKTALCADCRCVAQGELMPDGFVSPGPRGAELRYETKLTVSCFAAQTLRTLQAADFEKDEAKRHGRPAIVLRRTAEATSAWEIAKQYQTGVDAILRANELNTQEVGAGTMLLIPM